MDIEEEGEEGGVDGEGSLSGSLTDESSDTSDSESSIDLVCFVNGCFSRYFCCFFVCDVR